LLFWGGEPIFAEPLHVGRPNIGKRDCFLKRINDILDRRWLTNNGPYVQEFERKIEKHVGVKHCIATCNGSVGLEIAMRALSLTGEVIIPSMTFISTAHALQWQEITPVFCDIDPDTLCIDPKQVEQLITPKTTGILGVHLFGRSCNIKALTQIAKRRKLKIMFDAAHAFGCSYHNKMIGTFGDAEIFSFHATKFINAFEGGAILTNNQKLAKKIRLMKNFGFSGQDKVTYIGTNGKMSEVSAAMGLTSFESMHEFIEYNKRNYDCYSKELDNVLGVALQKFNEKEKSNYQYIVLLIDKHITRLTRDELQKVLIAENVLARRYFYPGCHKMEPYRSYFPKAGLVLPVTERVADKILLVPTGNSVDESEIQKICEIIKIATKNANKVSDTIRTKTR